MKDYSDKQKEKIKNLVMTWAEEFVQDESYKKLADWQKDEAMFIIDMFAEYMYGYFLQEPSEWTASALKECCLDIFPRKISAELNFYKSVEPVLTAFLQYLQYKGYIKNAPSLISCLKKISGRMVKLAENPEN
ncbi:MAG: hypothetical protein PWP66_587 [Thermosediminibacterales bacterium]|nr:hypothetical protein [Thermosediminibacterales bacterium]